MSDEAVLRIVLDEEQGSATAASSRSSSAGQQSLIPDKLNLDQLGHSNATIAKELVRPIKFIEDLVKARKYVDQLINHPDMVRDHSLIEAVKRRAEFVLAEMESLQIATGQQPIKTPDTAVEVDTKVNAVAGAAPAGVDPHEERRLFNEERKRRAAEAAVANAAGDAGQPPSVAPPVATGAPDPDDDSYAKFRAERLRKHKEEDAEDKLRQMALQAAAVIDLDPGPGPATDPWTEAINRRIDEGGPSGEHTFVGRPGGPVYDKKRREAQSQSTDPGPPDHDARESHRIEIETAAKKQEEMLDNRQNETMQRWFKEQEAERAAERANKPTSAGVQLDEKAARIEELKKDIERREEQERSGYIQAGSAAANKLAELRKELEELQKTVKEPGLVDGIRDVARALRGTLGGTFGRTVGGALDVLDVMEQRKEDEKDPNKKKKTGFAGGLEKAVPFIAIGAIVTDIVKGLAEDINKSVERYGEFNPAIAQAQAMAEMVKIMGDMRRAQEYGPALVEFVKAQTEMQQRAEDIKMKFMLLVIPMVTTIMNGVSAILGIAQDKDYEEMKDPTAFILNSEEVRKAREGSTNPLRADRDVLQLP